MIYQDGYAWQQGMLVGASVGLQHCEHPSLHSPALLLQDSVLYCMTFAIPI